MSLNLICRPRSSLLSTRSQKTILCYHYRRYFRVAPAKTQQHDQLQLQPGSVDSESHDSPVPLRHVVFDAEVEQWRSRAKRNSVARLARLSWSGSRAVPRSYFTTTWSKLLLALTAEADPQNRVRYEAALRAKEYILTWKASGSLPSSFGHSADVDIRFGQILPWLVAGSLVASPHYALEILNNVPWFHRDFTTRADCLIYLRQHWWRRIADDPELLYAYQRQLVRLQDASCWPDHNISTAYFQLLIHDASAEKGRELAAEYLKRYNSPSEALLLYIVDYCTKICDVDGALEAMTRLPPEVVEKSNLDILSRCTNLIMQDSIETVNGTPRFKVLTKLLELGIQPDAILHKMVIVNAFHARLPTVAWDLFRYTRENHVEINARAHLLLLKDAFENHNTENLNEIMSAVHEQEYLKQDPKLVGYTMNMLRVLYRDDRAFKSEDATARLLTIYDRAYNRSLLATLEIAPMIDASGTHPVPQPLTLGHAIWAYVLMQHDDSRVLGLWERFKATVEEGDAGVVALARHDILYNALIKFSDQDPRRLIKIAEVLEYMLEKGLCPPTPLTWSLALCAYLKHRQSLAAWTVWELMKESDMQWHERDWQYFLRRHPDTKIAKEMREILAGKASAGFSGVPGTSSYVPDVDVDKRSMAGVVAKAISMDSA